jgi:hypothetical protein
MHAVLEVGIVLIIWLLAGVGVAWLFHEAKLRDTDKGDDEK